MGAVKSGDPRFAFCAHQLNRNPLGCDIGYECEWARVRCIEYGRESMECQDAQDDCRLRSQECELERAQIFDGGKLRLLSPITNYHLENDELILQGGKGELMQLKRLAFFDETQKTVNRSGDE